MFLAIGIAATGFVALMIFLLSQGRIWATIIGGVVAGLVLIPLAISWGDAVMSH